MPVPKLGLSTTLAFSLIIPIYAQTGGTPAHAPQPLYRVTIVQRTTPAINYGHRAEPTKIDFRGTALLPDAHGDATVESKRGATMIDAHFNNVPPPTRFGREYLTYVVWAISPDGRAQSVGELVSNGSDKGHLTASTPMQAFALIVTAEPYYSVSQPSDVVVMENALRPETIGKVEQVNATYEMLPRKEYTYNVTSQPPPAAGPAVSMPEYEALVATYQAKNAIQIAISAGAEQYAPDRLKRAQQMFDQARQLSRKTLSDQVVADMREVAQAAEDARAVSALRSEQERRSREQSQTQQVAKQEETERAADQAAAEQARAEADRARIEAQQAAEQARQQAVQNPPPPPPAVSQSADRLEQRPADDTRERRADLRRRLSGAGFQTLDTPRGLVVIIPNSLLQASPEGVRGRLGIVASAMSTYPGLRAEVDGNADAGAAAASLKASQEVAGRVRDMLVGQGLPAASMTSYGYGNSRPTASNQTAYGKQQNQRVEIVISGDAIGTMPVWERTYTLQRHPQPR